MALPTIYLKNINLHATQIKDDTANIITQLDTIIAQGGGGGGGGGTGLSLESTQLGVLAGITNGFSQLHNDLTNQLTVNLVDVSGLATETTLSDTYNLLNNNFGTGGLSVSIKALNGDEITNTVVDTKRGLDVNIVNLPETQGISGIVDVGNFPTSFEISNLPATQPVSIADSVSITGMVSVSNTSFEVSNFPTSFEISNLPTTQPVSIADSVSVNILKTTSTIYDLTDNSSTLTGGDNRYEADRNRPDSWAYTNIKSQLGSSVYWYSNSSTSPQGTQQFNITQGMINTLYSVVSINKTANNDALPIMGLYSPSNTGFYTSRWVYTIDPSELLLQNEKVLLYWNNDPVDIYKDIRHIQLLFNAVASQGSLLSSEIVYLMSLNAPSAMASGAISYNIYNTGFVLNNGIHNDYQFTSGIKSKGDLLLSRLNEVEGNLGVNVGNTVNVAGASLDQMTFTTASGDNSIVGLNVITRNAYNPTIVTFTETDISIDDMTPSITLGPYNRLSVFGVSTHTGGGSHNIIVMYSNDNITYYDSPNTIASTGGKFAYDNSTFCVSYIKFRFQVEIQTLTFNVALK
jgi:hypothetical protein